MLFNENTLSDDKLIGECSVFYDQLKTADPDAKISHTMIHEGKKVGEIGICSSYLAPPKEEEEVAVTEDAVQVIQPEVPK